MGFMCCQRTLSQHARMTGPEGQLFSARRRQWTCSAEGWQEEQVEDLIQDCYCGVRLFLSRIVWYYDLLYSDTQAAAEYVRTV